MCARLAVAWIGRVPVRTVRGLSQPEGSLTLMVCRMRARCILLLVSMSGLRGVLWRHGADGALRWRAGSFVRLMRRHTRRIECSTSFSVSHSGVCACSLSRYCPTLSRIRSLAERLEPGRVSRWRRRVRVRVRRRQR